MTEAVDLSGLVPCETEAQDEPNFQLTEVPCTIHLKDGGTVRVLKIGAWNYMHQGIFVDDGVWNKKPGVCDLLIPFDQVRIIELHFDLLKEYLLAERAAPNAPSD